MAWLSSEQVEQVRRLTGRLLADEFEGNQSLMARALGISPSTINHLMNRKDERGPGLLFVLALRDHTGMTLDEILGLAPPRRRVADGELQARVEVAVTDALRRMLAAPVPAAPEVNPSEKRRRT